MAAEHLKIVPEVSTMPEVNGANELVKHVWLINVSVSVSGATRTTETVSDEREGETRETRLDVHQRIENEAQYKAAKKLESMLRALAYKYGANMDGYGTLTSDDSRKLFTRAFADAMTLIDEHNRIPGQTALIRAKSVTLPIGMTFGAGDISGILSFVGSELEKARAMLASGDVQGVSMWLQRGQRLADLAPALNGNVVREAIVWLREARNVVAKRIRESTDSITDPDTLRKVLDCPEFDKACEILDAAHGWVSPKAG